MISCIQNKHQVCFLASIENNMPGSLVSRTKIRSLFLRALKRHVWPLCIPNRNQARFLANIAQKNKHYICRQKTKITCVFFNQNQKTFCFPNNNSLWTGSFTTATYFIGLQNHNHTYRGRSTIMIPSTLTPRTNYCFHWTLVVDTGLAALKVGCFF